MPWRLAGGEVVRLKDVKIDFALLARRVLVADERRVAVVCRMM